MVQPPSTWCVTATVITAVPMKTTVATMERGERTNRRVKGRHRIAETDADLQRRTVLEPGRAGGDLAEARRGRHPARES